MVFKLSRNIRAMGQGFIAIASASFLISCTGGPYTDKGSENLIGIPLSSISSTVTSDSVEHSNIVIFDEVGRRIHQFDLGNMTHKRVLEVQEPKLAHYVLYDQVGNYVVDLTTKHVSIYDKNGSLSLDPIRFLGTPVSAAFRPDLGLLIVYDNLMTVGILKLDPNGNVISQRVAGAVVANGVTIESGDISDDGKLILGLSDNSVGVVDIDASLAQGKWKLDSFPTTLQQIAWVAPIPGQPSQVLIKANAKLAIFDLNTQAILSQVDIPTGFVIEKYSKARNPHVLIRSFDELRIYYVENGQILSRTLFHQQEYILSSQLDLAHDSWALITSTSEGKYYFNDPDRVREKRSVRTMRFSDQLALSSRSLPLKAQLRLSDSYVFALFPSDLGYAARYGLADESVLELKLFKIGYHE